MRIGIISDTHGDTRGWQAAIAGPLAGAELLIHAGDLLYHGPRNPMVEGYDPAALAELINSAPVPVIVARGNCDSDVDQLILDYPIQSPYALVVAEGLRIIVNHGDQFGLEDPLRGIAEVAQKYGADMFICGHTHTPLLERAGGALVMNPGSPSLPKAPQGELLRQAQDKPQPTVGIIEDDTARVVTLGGRTLFQAAVERRGGGAR